MKTVMERGEEELCEKRVIKECHHNERKGGADGGESRDVVWFRDCGPDRRRSWT